MWPHDLFFQSQESPPAASFSMLWSQSCKLCSDTVSYHLPLLPFILQCSDTYVQHSALIEWALIYRHHMEPIPLVEHMKIPTDHCDWINCCWCVTKAQRCLEVTAAPMGRSLRYRRPQEKVEGRRGCRLGSRTEGRSQSASGGRRAELRVEKWGRKMRRWLADRMTSLPRPITALVAPLDPPQLQLRGICLTTCPLTSWLIYHIIPQWPKWPSVISKWVLKRGFASVNINVQFF